MKFKYFKTFLESNPLNKLVLQYLAILSIILVFSNVIFYKLWTINATFAHTVLELACIFIEVSAFIIVWLTYRFNTPLSHVIGFGYLVVAVFDLFHIYLFPGLNLYPKGYFDLSARFWSMGRFAEAMIVLVLAFKLYNGRINRWLGLLGAIIFAQAIAQIILFIPEVMPVLATKQGPTPAKMILDFVVMLAFLIGLYKLRNNTNEKNIMTYRYILLALMIAIPTQICFILARTNLSFFNMLGHVLKFIYYVFIFKGIYISAVEYPYEKLKEEQQKLIQQEKLALLGQMGAAIVHETKNSLATIKGTSQLLSSITKDDKIKGYAQKIDNATNEVNRIISDFLNLSKPKTPELCKTSLNYLIQSMKSTLEASLLLDGIDFRMSLESNEQHVMCDEAQIKQVILNISKNAVEAMTSIEKPALDIITRFDAERNSMLLIIADNGIGMSEEERKKLGTPFFTTKEKGTGLGLSTCFQIIREHGGEITIESEYGKGTTFIISLPCRSRAAA